MCGLIGQFLWANICRSDSLYDAQSDCKLGDSVPD